MDDLAVTDEMLLPCECCGAAFGPSEGWLGLCASCEALLDDHREGWHPGTDVEACRTCETEVGGGFTGVA